MKRSMVGWTALLALTAALMSGRGAVAAQSAPARQAPMNVIFILLDDLPIDSLGFVNPKLQTPNIDQLAKGGVYVPRAAVTTALCSPSRATILTGMTTRNHRIVDNNNSSEKGLVYFPTYLQRAGYQTAYFGKWHMGSDSDAPRPGFDHWVSFAGQGTYGPRGDFARPVQQTLNVDGKRVDRTDYITDELTRYQLQWLDKGRNPRKPFFIYMSHKAVHGPCMPAQRHAAQYSGATMSIPENASLSAADARLKPMWVINQHNSWHGLDVQNPGGVPALLDSRRRCDEVLSAVDDSVGATLKYLREHGLERNTMIVFFSDNGSMWGAQGLTDKRNAYEESVRVPMIAWAPGYLPAGVVSDARVRNLDLAPTFLDIAGVKPPAEFEGRSVLPLLQGKTAWKDWPQDDFVYEYYWEWSYPMTPTTFAIVRNDLKYIQYHGVWDLEELYDLKRDPHELHNLIFDPAYRQQRVELRQRLYQQLSNRRGENVVAYSERRNQGFAFRHAEGSPAARFPEQWELKPKQPGAAFSYEDINPLANQE